MSELRTVMMLNTFDLRSRLSATLRVMKSSRAKTEPMNIWESDILAIEDAIAAITPPPSPQDTTGTQS